MHEVIFYPQSLPSMVLTQHMVVALEIPVEWFTVIRSCARSPTMQHDWKTSWRAGRPGTRHLSPVHWSLAGCLSVCHFLFALMQSRCFWPSGMSQSLVSLEQLFSLVTVLGVVVSCTRTKLILSQWGWQPVHTCRAESGCNWDKSSLSCLSDHPSYAFWIWFKSAL